MSQEVSEIDETKEEKNAREIRVVEEDLGHEKLRLQKELVDLVNVTRTTKPSTLFFTDESGRPVAWAFWDIWHGLQESGDIGKEEKIPVIRFANIGRFQEKERYRESSKAMKSAREYDIPKTGKILIVDDFSDTGTTLKTSKEVVEKLFPNREILCHAVLAAVAPWHSFGEHVIGVANTEQMWVSRSEEGSGKQLRAMVKSYISNPAIERVKNGQLKLGYDLPRPYSDPSSKSKIQNELNIANREILLKSGIIEEVEYSTGLWTTQIKSGK